MTKTPTGSLTRVNGRAANAAPKLTVVALAALLAATTAADAADAGITVENPWMRIIIKARPAAGYFTLENHTGSPVDLTGAASSACGMIMLHEAENVNGVEKMHPVKSVIVPAHGTLSFAPGGYHMMCMSPGDAMTVGATAPVTLKFSDGKSITAQFPVKGANAQ